MITANAQKNPFEMSNDLLTGAAQGYGDLAAGNGLMNINKYINPFYEQVYDRVIGRMDEDRQIQKNNMGDVFNAAGAFGGNRRGLYEAEIDSRVNQNIGDVGANLMMQGYDSAADRLYRDMTTGLQGQSQLGQNFYNIGSNISDRQMQQGTMQQSILQQILSGGAQQFDQYMQNPYQTIDMMNALLQGDVRRNNVKSTQQYTPGIFDFLSLGAQAIGGLPG